MCCVCFLCWAGRSCQVTHGFILKRSLHDSGIDAKTVFPLSAPPAGGAAGDVGLVGLVGVAASLLWISCTCFGLETASDWETNTQHDSVTGWKSEKRRLSAKMNLWKSVRNHWDNVKHCWENCSFLGLSLMRVQEKMAAVELPHLLVFLQHGLPRLCCAGAARCLGFYAGWNRGIYL